MNSKQIIIIVIFLMAFFLYSRATNADAQNSYRQSLEKQEIATCGKAPGDAPTLTKLTWALCQSKAAVDNDNKAGK